MTIYLMLAAMVAVLFGVGRIVKWGGKAAPTEVEQRKAWLLRSADEDLQRRRALGRIWW